MKTQSEQSIQTKILTYLTKIGAYSVKTISTNKAGVPDILACIDGRFVAIEVKRHGGKVSPLQNYQIKAIKETGGIAFVAYCVDDVRLTLLEEGFTNVS